MFQIPWWRTSFGDEEVEKLRESVADEHINHGPVTAQFEARFAEALNVPYALATTSGSVALLLSLMAMGIGRDDEVIVPNRTWIACAHAALLIGAKVKLVDVLPDLTAIDVSQIRQAITPRTKAIMPVHLNGRPVDMVEIQAIADEYGLFVVEDACQSLFSRNSAGYLGTQSHVGCFSLGMTKLISTGQGGVVVTRSEETYETLKLVRNHGVVDSFSPGSWKLMGFNFRYTDLQASFGLVQLSRASGRIQRLNEVYARYSSAIDEFEMSFLKLIPVKTEHHEVPLYVEAVSDERDQLVEFLTTHGIQVRIFMPSLHTSEYLENPGEFPRSEVFSRKGLFLPCGPDQPLKNVDRVIEVLRLYGERRNHN